MRRRRRAPWLTLVALLVALAGLGFTEWRLWQGIDLLDESFYVAVPYRFSLGARPFVDESNILQIPALLTYPLIKPFVAAQGGHADGIMMYTRHLYLLFVLGVGAGAFLALRRLLRWQLALLIASVFVTFVMFDLTQLSYNTMGSGFLTLGIAFVVLGVTRRGSPEDVPQFRMPRGRSRGWLVAAGLSYGLAGFAFPTFWAVAAVNLVLLAVCLRNVIAADERGEDGRTAPRLSGWLAGVGAYAVGAGLVFAAEVGLILSFGWHNVRWSLGVSMNVARGLHQVGGWTKVSDVFRGLGHLLWLQPLFVVAALLLLLVVRRWPSLGRLLLVLLPVPLYFAGQRLLLGPAGFAIVGGLLALYLYAFVPRQQRHAARVLLLLGTAPAVAAGLLAAWTSAAGWTHAGVGMFSGFLVTGTLLCWALMAAVPCREAALTRVPDSSRPAQRRVWLPTAVLAAVVGITVVFQFQYIARAVPYSDLTVWMSSGPYWGIHTTSQRKAFLTQFAADLRATTTSRDRLLVYQQFPGAYLYWPYQIASDSVWISSYDERLPLPQVTVDWLRERRIAPDVVIRTVHTGSLTNGEYAAQYGAGLGYPVSLRRREYAFLTRPPGYEPSLIFGAQAGTSQR